MNEQQAHKDTFSLKGKVVLITGAARGLGLAYANATAGAGAHVVLNDRDPRNLSASVEKLKSSGFSCSASLFDVTAENEVTEAVSAIVAEHGRIDVLVNNAGNQIRKPFVDYSLAEWRSVIEVHLTGTFLVTRAVAPHMIKNRDGSIIMVGSVLAQSVRFTLSPYVTAKGAVTALAKALAVELGPHGVRCNVIAPGFVETDFNQALRDKPDVYKGIADKVPLKRWGQPSDVAPVLVYLASNAGRYVNGQTFVIDGGLLASL
jgi:gluconate 5-dehydrogenase